MHFHNPVNSASATQYAVHPDSWSAHPEAEYLVFPAEVLPSGHGYADRRKDRSHHGQVQVLPDQGHVQFHRLSYRSYKNHAVLKAPGKYRFRQADVPSLPDWHLPSVHTSDSSLFPFQKETEKQSAEHHRSSCLFPERNADPDSRHGHFLPIRPFLHPESAFR